MTRRAARARVAVIGAGMAGVTCARLLADAGHAVQLFDKSRGVGGRMATRRAPWSGADGAAHEARFDHGTPGFTARSAEFAGFVEEACRDGLLARWSPVIAPGSYQPLGDSALWVPTPDMPSLCRALLGELPVSFGCTVDALRHGPAGWRVECAGAVVGDGFSEVVVAVPPPQAAPLLQAHHAEWAQRARSLAMSPGWTLMATIGGAQASPEWDLAWPTEGPLSWIVRNDAKPGRERLPGVGHWVAHATASWSQTHLESPAEDVQSALQAALTGWLNGRLVWHHAAVHRWRYATVLRADGSTSAEPPGRCWWDAARGLGVCGDALGGAGVEGAWASGRALAAAIDDHGHGHSGAAIALSTTSRTH